MSLLTLSGSIFVRYDRINCCEIIQKDDTCVYVKWYTEDGEFVSDAFTGKVSARNYIKEINKHMSVLDAMDLEEE